MPHLFAFEEADHLTRVHLKLALEDIGFAVDERERTIAILGHGGTAQPVAKPLDTPHKTR
ncbi:hypothetical protein NF700_07075 [Sphingomonadaceae bacterium OTU29MARTA1]|uniref:hypothetical protein n=1 Tax=Sphingomonas sp. Leaf37 TaxID=2876552 RepID=UPI001E645181|nr:hypothetical protein [Sphingomonas sp. Leaf37]USU06643.1 hypothetical protein NF699_08290 [Sphingomonadaceae bacterium OTU29LAMAA1]USU10012.1 hypothetical protein NF700_07075 [Sphingomonadaceae bacterium OTU29MARTA1]